jgi:hypothetical protein
MNLVFPNGMETDSLSDFILVTTAAPLMLYYWYYHTCGVHAYIFQLSNIQMSQQGLQEEIVHVAVF